jgi:hypothetical protein
VNSPLGRLFFDESNGRGLADFDIRL